MGNLVNPKVLLAFTILSIVAQTASAAAAEASISNTLSDESQIFASTSPPPSQNNVVTGTPESAAIIPDTKLPIENEADKSAEDTTARQPAPTAEQVSPDKAPEATTSSSQHAIPEQKQASPPEARTPPVQVSDDPVSQPEEKKRTVPDKKKPKTKAKPQIFFIPKKPIQLFGRPHTESQQKEMMYEKSGGVG